MTQDELETWIDDYDNVLKAIRAYIHRAVGKELELDWRFDGIILAWDGRFRVRLEYMFGTEKRDTVITIMASDILPYLESK